MRGPSTGQEENPGLNPALWPKAAAPAAPGLARTCLGCVGVTVRTGHGLDGTPLPPGRGSCGMRKGWAWHRTQERAEWSLFEVMASCSAQTQVCADP